MVHTTKRNGIYNGVVDPFEEYMAIRMKGVEEYSKVFITITTTADNSRIDRTLDIDHMGNASSDNILGSMLLCGGNTYTLKISIQDRAGNNSQIITQSVTSHIECGYCGNSAGSNVFIYPIQEQGRIGVINDGYLQTPRLDGLHAGVDFNVHLNDPVRAVYQGTVVKVDSLKDDKGNYKGFGNYIVLKHILPNDPVYGTSSTLFSIYAHLNTKPTLPIGQQVSQGQIIGRAGSTGWSSGPHLHFQLQRVGSRSPAGTGDYTEGGLEGSGVINPMPYFPSSTSNIPQPLTSKYCLGGYGSSQNAYEVPSVSKEEAEREIAYYINNNLGWWSEIENWKDRGVLGINWNQYRTRADDLDRSKVNDINSIISLLDVYSVCNGNRWIQNMGRVDNGNNTKRTGDGMLAINPWNIESNRSSGTNLQTVFLIQDRIFNDYTGADKLNYACGIPLGYPASEQGVAVGTKLPAWDDPRYQRFQIRKDQDYLNSLYQRPNGKTFAVLGDVVADYESNGGTGGKYGYPEEHTQQIKGEFCLQRFGNGYIAICNDLENLQDYYLREVNESRIDYLVIWCWVWD